MTSVPYYVPIGCRSDIVRLLGANGDDVKDRAVFEFKVNLEMVLAKQVDTKMNFRSWNNVSNENNFMSQENSSPPLDTGHWQAMVDG